MLNKPHPSASQLKKTTLGRLMNLDTLLDAVSNPYSALAGVIATIGTFVVDSLGSGTIVLLSLTVLILVVGVFREASKAAIYEQGAIPLPIVINVSSATQSQSALDALFNIIERDHRFRKHGDNLAQHLKILREDLIHEYRGNIHDIERLKLFLQFTRRDLERLKTQPSTDTIFHLAYIGPASVGILIGTLLGLDGIVIYQFNKTSKSYYPVIEVDDP